MAVIIGSDIVFSPKNPLQLRDFPSGKAKIRIRPNEFVTVYIRNEAGITKFAVKEKDGYWIPAFVMEINRRETL